METQANEEKKVLTVNDVARILQITVPSAYELAKAADFPSFRIGKRVIIPTAAFERWLQSDALGKRYASYQKYFAGE